jgi:hypothetical protein
MISNDKENKNILNPHTNTNITLAVVYDSNYISQETAEKDIHNIFSNINKLGKGIIYSHPHVEIDNKYYTSKIVIKTFSDMEIPSNNESTNIEGVILYFASESIKSSNKIFSILQKLNREDGFDTSIVIFKEDKGFLSTMSYYEEFVGQAIDRHFEIIGDILNMGDINEDDGIGALNMSLQSTNWSNSIPKKIGSGKNNFNQKENNNDVKEEVKHLDENKVEQSESENKYELMKDDIQFDKFIENLNDIRQINKNENISDEERRTNAENAILMLAKFLKLDEDGEEGDNDSDN